MAEKIMFGILLVVIISVIAIAFFAVKTYKKNKGELQGTNKIKRRIGRIVLCLVLVGIVGVNVTVYHFNNVINIYFNKVSTNTEEVKSTVQKSADINQKISEEGIVMLENKNNTLPLKNDDQKNINIFGIGSVGTVFTTSVGANIENQVTLQDALKNSGFKVNDELTNFYTQHMPEEEKEDVFNLFGSSCDINEVSRSEYNDELITNAKEFSDVAVVVISREGSEGGDEAQDMEGHIGGDAGRNYLELQSVEEDMISMVKENFSTIIVLVNTSNAIELGFLEDESIDAALWIGAPGTNGITAVGEILAGDVNPSGRTVDTWAYDITSAPSFMNLGNFQYTNGEYESTNSFTGKNETSYYTYMDYAEGIYVGYRYYETRWIDNNTSECDQIEYNKAVQYPFGYGLSYTSFKQNIENFSNDGTTITMDVKVTNSGEVAGKDVIQVYYTAPYYVGGIEKSQVVLSGFGKTEILEPGASEIVKISFPIEEMASYDYKKEKAYVLEKGDYTIKLMNNSHDVIDSKKIKINDTIIYNEENDGARSTDEIIATNQFDDLSNGNDVTYVSRADWEGTLPKSKGNGKAATDEILEELKNPIIENNPEDEDIVIKDNGLKLSDMKGLDYDDPKWDQLLEQVSIEEMSNLIGYGGWTTKEVPSVEAPTTNSVDGPSGISGYIDGVSSLAYSCEVLVASTWNLDLANKFGQYFGDEMIAFNYDGLYGPGMNIHRSPFSGRNFEYYSEDAFLSGKMAAAEISGLQSKGVVVHMKHFAINDQETNRWGVCTWANEQSIREIYLKPFEMCVKEVDALGIMGSFNRIGTKWTGASKELNTTVLRDEWGYKGLVITDYDGQPYMDVDLAVRAGVDLMESTTGDFPTKLTTESNTGKQAMRNATKHVLYRTLNSDAMNKASVFPMWTLLPIGVDIILLILISLGFSKLNTNKNTKKNKEEIQKC